MPIFNEQTNLQGQGRFSPGVTYYAGIRAPSQPIPSMPKSDASFNIDLSSIGNAMIAAKESETKLGMAAIEMEQNLQQAEKDRELRRDLAAMEDARARDIAAMQEQGANARLDRELASKWQIANLKNDTELAKLRKERSAAVKEDNLAQAELALLNNEELNQAYIDYSADPSKRALEYQTIRNRIVSQIATEYGVAPSKLLSVNKGAGMSEGLGVNIQNANDIAKKVAEDTYDQRKALAQTLNSGLYATNPDAAMAQAEGFIQRSAQIRQYQSLREIPGQSQHIVDFANNQINSDVKNIALDIALASASAAQNELGTRSLSNPSEYLDLTKQIAAAEIVAETELGYGEVRPLVDAAYMESGINGTVNTIYKEAGDNSQYIKNMLQYTKDTGMLDIMQNGPEFAKTALIVGNIPLFNSLDPSEKKMYSQIVSGALFGRVRPISNADGERGWAYSYRGKEVRYSEEEINSLGKKLGLDVRKPDEIAAFVGSQILSNGGVKSGVDKGIILQQDAYPIIENTVKNVTGNKNSETGLETFNLSKEDKEQMTKNITYCSENDICTSEDIMSNIDTFPKGSKEYNKVLQIGRGYEAEVRLGKFFKNSSDSEKFNDAVRYIFNPSNIKGEDVAKFFGKKYEDDPEKWNNWDLKNTKIYYKVEDGKAVLKYYQDGWFKTGGTELQKRMDYVSNVLTAAGVPLEGQIAFYNNSSKEGILSTDVKESTFNKALTTAQEFIFDNAAKADTEFLSWLTKEDEEILKGEYAADEYAFGAGFALGSRPDIENKMWEKLDQLGKEDYGLLKQGYYALTSLLAYSAGAVTGSIAEASAQWTKSAVEMVLEANKILKETRGFGFTDKERKVANKIAKQMAKENKKQNKILTADEAYELFMSNNKPWTVTITPKPGNTMSLEDYELQQSIDKELESLK